MGEHGTIDYYLQFKFSTGFVPSGGTSHRNPTKIKTIDIHTLRWSNNLRVHQEVRPHALRTLTSVIYDRRSLKVLTIYDPRYRENASTTYDLRSLPFLTIRDLRSMTFQLTIDDLSPFVRFTIYGSRGSIRCLRSTIDDLSFNVGFVTFSKKLRLE